jgi:hypothetical protein
MDVKNRCKMAAKEPEKAKLKKDKNPLCRY